MRFPTAKTIDQFPCFLGESIYAGLGATFQYRVDDLGDDAVTHDTRAFLHRKLEPRIEATFLVLWCKKPDIGLS